MSSFVAALYYWLKLCRCIPFYPRQIQFNHPWIRALTDALFLLIIFYPQAMKARDVLSLLAFVSLSFSSSVCPSVRLYGASVWGRLSTRKFKKYFPNLFSKLGWSISLIKTNKFDQGYRSSLTMQIINKNVLIFWGQGNSILPDFVTVFPYISERFCIKISVFFH